MWVQYHPFSLVLYKTSTRRGYYIFAENVLKSFIAYALRTVWSRQRAVNSRYPTILLVVRHPTRSKHHIHQKFKIMAQPPDTVSYLVRRTSLLTKTTPHSSPHSQNPDLNRSPRKEGSIYRACFTQKRNASTLKVKISEWIMFCNFETGIEMTAQKKPQTLYR